MLLVLDLHDLSAGIMAAVGADVVRQVLVAAISTGDDMPWPERIVSTAPIASTF